MPKAYKPLTRLKAIHPMRKLVFLGLFLFFITGALSAEPELQLHLAPTTRVVLPNGLVLLIRERHDIDNVGLYLSVGAGQLTEEDNQKGITNLLQNYLLEIPINHFHDAATAIESKGGVIGASSGPDRSHFDLNVTKEEFPFALKIVTSLLHLQSINDPIFKDAKDNDLIEIRRESQESYQFLNNLFLQEFYSFHPYKSPVIGLASTVKSIKPQDLLDYFAAYYVPNNMVLSVVGDVNTDRVIKLVNDAFSDLKGHALKPNNIYYQPILDDDKQIQLQSSSNVAWLFLGFSAPELKSPSYPAMDIVNSILGASMSSRIWLTIREKHALSYELGSQYSAREGPSHFIIYVATSPDNLLESRRHLLDEVNRIRREALTPEELMITKRRLVGQFILSLETNSAQAQFLSNSEMEGKGMMYDETYIDSLEKVTSDEVLKTAKKYLENYIFISVE